MHIALFKALGLWHPIGMAPHRRARRLAAASRSHAFRFTRAMVEFLQARVCVDPELVFTNGFSNGGFMSYRLACEASDLVPGGPADRGTALSPPPQTVDVGAAAVGGRGPEIVTTRSFAPSARMRATLPSTRTTPAIK